MYKVQFASYCGMSGVPYSFDDDKEAREYAAKRILAARKRTKVTTLERGQAWEVLEPEGCQMVPDYCGTLHLDHITFECRECGSQCETQDDANRCCSESEVDFQYEDD